MMTLMFPMKTDVYIHWRMTCNVLCLSHTKEYGCSLMEIHVTGAAGSLPFMMHLCKDGIVGIALMIKWVVLF